METKELLGRRVRELRKKKGLTQERLAEIAALDVKYLGGIERGTENPTIETLEKLANALSVRVSQILDFEHEIHGERLLRRRINQVLDKCNERELQIILRLVSAVKD
ncbi:MAG TPA: XRE family transcriptional regulator [Deltaproteobacteria bacterium]|nr:XRE family transcriptional regulator [Deltaproteobacteria bacterium]